MMQKGYYSCVETKNQLGWDNNTFFYYTDCDSSISLPENLPELKEQQIYVQKHYWTNGKDIISKDFAVAGVE